MSSVSSAKSGAVPPSARPAVRSLHHLCFRCFDAEETRRFYEDLLGLEFYAALPSGADLAGKPVESLQILFRMAAGDFIGFYDVPDDLKPDMFEHLGGLDLHLGMKVSSEAELMKWAERLTQAGIQFAGPLDHEFIRSIYFKDPNGLLLELTYKVAQHDEIIEREKANAKEALDVWTVKTSARKAKFKKAGAAA